MQAADDLLVEHGIARLTVEAIAQRAGVAKQTIYRWWPSKTDLQLDAFLTDAAEELTPASDAGIVGGADGAVVPVDDLFADGQSVSAVAAAVGGGPVEAVEHVRLSGVGMPMPRTPNAGRSQRHRTDHHNTQAAVHCLPVGWPKPAARRPVLLPSHGRGPARPKRDGTGDGRPRMMGR
ncbi:TetR/AcrR family transcriptional regulator [Virgisporangium aurantiacum]|uniref:HTH tetR-type domain-containing protein n=1 Tax=Virgisporangium aurantiacum TaxID=175570 RepID=A0A8J3ZKP3_9ACTN|nr:hypothetical protein Vau01_107310 [Virgisporangium aurantiacum]